MAPTLVGKMRSVTQLPKIMTLLNCSMLAVVPVTMAALLSGPDLSAVTSVLLFTRPKTAGCVPEDELSRSPAAALRNLTDGELAAFARDGSVQLRGLLDDVWLNRLRALVQDCFEHPNIWDVVYSRMIANFYCAQKAILVHHTSTCGRQIAVAAPTTRIAAKLLGSPTLRVCEPSAALGNFRRPAAGTWGGLVDGCGTTGFHTDDAYIPVRRRNPERAAVVRLWVPLAPFTTDHFRFAALNESRAARSERAAAGNGDLYGTSYSRDEKLAQSGILTQPGQVLEGSNLQPGDVFAFASETAHTAEALDCHNPEAHGCLRLILSFAGDNAIFVSDRSAGMIPLHDNQTDGNPLQGVQFPTVFPEPTPGEWQPLRPSIPTLAASLWHAVRAGVGSFAGFSLGKQTGYLLRVSWFAAPWSNFWDYIDFGRDQATPKLCSLSLTRHFGGAAIEWLFGGVFTAR